MEFNVAKCSILPVTLKQHKVLTTYEYTINGTTLNTVSQHSYLEISQITNYLGILTLKHSVTKPTAQWDSLNVIITSKTSS